MKRTISVQQYSKLFKNKFGNTVTNHYDVRSVEVNITVDPNWASGPSPKAVKPQFRQGPLFAILINMDIFYIKMYQR